MNQRNREYRLCAIKALGGKCVQCGFSNPLALEFDYKLCRGKRPERAIHGAKLYCAVIRGENPGVQLLCCNCHAIKTHADREALLASRLPRVRPALRDRRVKWQCSPRRSPFDGLD